MVWLEAHWSTLLQDGLVGCMQPLANSWCRVVIVVMVTRGRVIVVIVVHRLVGIIVLLLPEEVGVEISVEAKRCSVKCENKNYETNLLVKLKCEKCIQAGHWLFYSQ